jgi:hypothetical protein
MQPSPKQQMRVKKETLRRLRVTTTLKAGLRRTDEEQPGTEMNR